MNYQPYPNNAYGYTVPRPQARNTQPLTPEQINKLRQNASAFDMKIEQEDIWRATCTHKEKDGRSTLISIGDNRYKCTICGEEFEMSDISKQEVEEMVTKMIDMLQTAKTVYLDVPEELARQYFQIIPLLKKFPYLWERAISCFEKYENPAMGVNPMSPGYSGFAAIQNYLTNPYAGYPQAGYQYQQPNYGCNPGFVQPGYQAGYMPAQPNYGYAPPVQQMPDMTGNPMAYGAPNVVPTPAAAPAPGVMPGAAQPVPAPAAAPANAQQGEVKQQQVFNV